MPNDKAPTLMPSAVLRFRIGDAFPADDYLAVWAAEVGMIFNDLLLVPRLSVAPEASNLQRAYFVRLTAAHLWEAAKFLSETCLEPPVQSLLARMPTDRRADLHTHLVVYELAYHPLHRRVRRARNLLFHYPELKPTGGAPVVRRFRPRGRRRHRDHQDMLEALQRMAKEEGVIEAWPIFGDTRAWFAADLALNLIMENHPDHDEEAARDFLAKLVGPTTALMRFSEAALTAYMDGLPAGNWAREDRSPSPRP
jgi:hypothetical protein